ncbi:MAG: preprotein translocase subunit SecD [Lentisphaeria bacterium]|jgi:preprotein translocase subunit SecD
MNRYPLWKYVLILAITVLGIIYALPNIYAPDPAIQVSGTSASGVIDDAVMARVEEALTDADIRFFGVESTGSSGLIRLYDADDQLLARRVAQERLEEREYVVAVNMAQTTPQRLLDIGGGPMKFGLDLAGGVHFLLEVDTKKLLSEEMGSNITELKKYVREERMRGVALNLVDNTILVNVNSEELRDKITSHIRKDLQQLEYRRTNDGANYSATLSLSESYIREKETLAVEQNLTALRKRVNELGVSEPLVQRQGRNRIVVQLPGIQDTARAKSIVGKTANLEFRLEALPDALSSQKELFPFADEKDQAAFGGAYLEKRILIKGEHVTNASASFDSQTSLPQINISLNSEGGTIINRNTRNNIGRRMAVVFIEYHTVTKIEHDENGNEVKVFTQIPEKKIINRATIQSALNMNFRITGISNSLEASETALLLRAGALAAPMGFVEERTIGPSMGRENVAAGKKSVQIGLLAVMLFMMAYYRVFGVASNIALMVNLALLVAIMSLFGATLTMPGIAGIVLTVGMAVDANVLIFSRIREELRNGMPNQSAINAGFDRAFSTILDANITTFIVAIILYAIGSGPIKGFAVTLAIGIVTSMFSAIMVTRAVVNAIYGNRPVKKLWI